MTHGSKEKLVGSLLKYKGIKREDLDLYFLLLFKSRYKLLAPLRDIIDDDYKFLQILDLFAGTRIWFPPRDRTYRVLERATSYNYLKERNFSHEAYKALAKRIDRRLIQTKTLMDTVDRVLTQEKTIRKQMRDIDKLLEESQAKDNIQSYNFEFTEGDDIGA